jgi:predicted MPP superfamily phosphohydrolase
MPCVGRGRYYGRLRALGEWLAIRLFAGGWPARVAFQLGAQREVRLVEHDLPVPDWPAAAPALTFAFGSDFHAGPTTHPKLIDLAFERMAEARPDVLLLGGDFVFLEAHHVERLARAAGRVPAPAGKYAVLGNHDLWADHDHITRELERAGVRVLVNESARLPAPFDHVSVCGLDEYWSGDADAASAFAGAAPVRILLMHAPSGLLAVNGEPFSVAVCGHTHGGHLALPGERPIYIPQRALNGRYPFGRFRLPEPQRGDLIVSRGIGHLEAPFRTWAPPDVIVGRLGGTS